jgi:N-acetylglucosaminyldiphosphoundecaprenol N-acetyl-beta-D-mannosaminyltransferase
MITETQANIERANVLGVGVHAVNMNLVASILAEQIKSGSKGYVCLVGVHGVMEARRDYDLWKILAEASLALPDGMPTVWMGHLQGHSKMCRIFGPDLMVEIMRREEFRDCVHFLCGGSPGVAEKLRDAMVLRFPEIRIAGIFVPPFRQMTAEEEVELLEAVRVQHVDIIWVGMSTPKQEKFMACYLPMLDTKLMIGVGAAFLFHTGLIKDSSYWVKRMGLQWLVRLLQEPGRLWKRYLQNIPPFIFLAILQVIGWRRYKLVSSKR